MTSHHVTFAIPKAANHHPYWTMRLWSIAKSGEQHLVASDGGTKGDLVIQIPLVKGCDFQVDVLRNSNWYSGFRRELKSCGQTSSSTSSPSSTTSTTQKPNSTPTTQKPSTTGSSRVPTTAASHTKPSKSGGGTKTATATATKATSVSPSKLAFTGVGPGMWILASLGALLMLAGGLLLGYARRYPSAA
jgi:cobalamin biosynthesis Mg chelatase CobN